MRKITIMITTLLIGFSYGNAQEFNNLKDYIHAGRLKVIHTNVQPTVYNRATEETTLFTTLEEFNENCDSMDGLNFENFEGGPDVFNNDCGMPLNSSGNACFPAGELIDGFEITTSASDINSSVFYIDPLDGFGNTDPIVGAGVFIDFTIINFIDETPVTSFSFDLYVIVNGGDVEMRIIDIEGGVETVTIDASSIGPIFVAGISDTAIASIEIEELSGTQTELIANLRFGSCDALLTDEPEDALPLTVGEVFEDFPRDVDNTNTTASEEVAPSCGDFQGGDSWYTVVVPNLGNVTIETGMTVDSTLDDTVLAIYEGPIENLTEIACNDNSSTSTFSLVTLMDRTPGEVLYIRVFESGNNVTGLYQIAAYSDCAVVAPEISIAGLDLVEFFICVGNGIEDFIDVDQTGGLNIGVESWVITDNATGAILALPMAPPFEFDSIPAGVCAIYNIRHNDDLVGLELGENINDLEGCFDLSNPILIDRVSEGGVCDTCEFTLEMNDSFGDGWNGAEIDVLVDGLVVLDNATLDDGFQGVLSFLNIDGAEISVVVENEGAFPIEVSYRILNNLDLGQEVAVGDLTILPDPFVGVCVDCNLPEVDVTVELLCNQGLEEFIVVIETTSLSESTQLTVSNDVTGDELIIDSEGSAAYGPFSFDTAPFILTIIPDDALCSLTFDIAGDNLGCPPTNDNCIDAIAVTDGDIMTVNTDFATVDNVTNCAQDPASLGVWYFINDGGTAIDVTIDTIGSGYDTFLAYYTGSCDNLTCVGSNDDIDPVFGNFQSEISFNTGGTGENIYILATGFDAIETGDLVLNVAFNDVLSTKEESFIDNDITLFPNPAINDIEISSREVIDSVNIYSLSGQVVLQKTINETQDLIDVSNLTSGLYLMKFISNGQSATKKFIKR